MPIPDEFRADVVGVACESGVTIKQIAIDFGISEATPQNWFRQDDVDEGNRRARPPRTLWRRAN